MAQKSILVLPQNISYDIDKTANDKTILHVGNNASKTPTCEDNISHNKLEITNGNEYKQSTITTKCPLSKDKIDNENIKWCRMKDKYLYDPAKQINHDTHNISKTIIDQLRQQHWDHVDHNFKLNKIHSDNTVLKHQINVLNNDTEYIAYKSNDNFNMNKRYLNQIRNEQISLKEQNINMKYKSIFIAVIIITIMSICFVGMYYYMNNHVNDIVVQMEQKLFESMKVHYNKYANHINALELEILTMNETNNNIIKTQKTHKKVISELENQLKEQSDNITTLKHIHNSDMEVVILEMEEQYWRNNVYLLVTISIVTILVYIIFFFNAKKQRQCNKHNYLIDDFLKQNGYIKTAKNLINDTPNTKAKTVPTNQPQNSSSQNTNQNQHNNNNNTNNNNNHSNNNNNNAGNNHSRNNRNSSGNGGNGGRPPKKNIGTHDDKSKKKKRKKKPKKTKQDTHNTTGSKSAPNPITTKLTPKTLNPDAPIFSPPNSPPQSKIKSTQFSYACLTINEMDNKPINEQKKGEDSPRESSDSASSLPKKKRKNSKKKKKKNKKGKRNKKNNLVTNETTYTASDTLRGQGKILVGKEMMAIISSTIKEKYNNLNDFMDKSVAISGGLEQSLFHTEHGEIKILNYDFHHKDTNETMYCILKKDQKAIDGNYDWSVTALMNANNIKNVYDINSFNLPLSFRDNDVFNMEKIINQQQKLKAILADSSKIFTLIKHAPWTNSNIVQVFFKKNGHQTTTLSIEKERFMKKCKENVGIAENIELMPILVFKKDNFWVEYVWIISVDNSTNIGISFKYGGDNDVKITGIHCDKDCLLQQHQLISCGSEGQLLNNFTSNITYLNVCGNPSPKLYRSRFQKSKDFIKKWVNTRPIDVESFRRDGSEFVHNINSNSYYTHNILTEPTEDRWNKMSFNPTMKFKSFKGSKQQRWDTKDEIKDDALSNDIRDFHQETSTDTCIPERFINLLRNKAKKQPTSEHTDDNTKKGNNNQNQNKKNNSDRPNRNQPNNNNENNGQNGGKDSSDDDDKNNDKNKKNITSNDRNNMKQDNEKDVDRFFDILQNIKNIDDETLKQLLSTFSSTVFKKVSDGIHELNESLQRVTKMRSEIQFPVIDSMEHLSLNIDHESASETSIDNHGYSSKSESSNYDSSSSQTGSNRNSSLVFGFVRRNVSDMDLELVNIIFNYYRKMKRKRKRNRNKYKQVINGKYEYEKKVEPKQVIKDYILNANWYSGKIIQKAKINGKAKENGRITLSLEISEFIRRCKQFVTNDSKKIILIPLNDKKENNKHLCVVTVDMKKKIDIGVSFKCCYVYDSLKSLHRYQVEIEELHMSLASHYKRLLSHQYDLSRFGIGYLHIYAHTEEYYKYRYEKLLTFIGRFVKMKQQQFDFKKWKMDIEKIWKDLIGTVTCN